MKTLLKFSLLTFLTTFFTCASAATAWFPVGKDGANTNYFEKEVCESTEGMRCLNVAECPLDECRVGAGDAGEDVLVVDPDKVAAKKARLEAEVASQAAAAQALKDSKDRLRGCLQSINAVSTQAAKVNAQTACLADVLKVLGVQ